MKGTLSKISQGPAFQGHRLWYLQSNEWPSLGEWIPRDLRREDRVSGICHHPKGVRLVACPQVLIPDGEPDARARLSSERCLPLDPFVASDIPDGRRPSDLQKRIKN